MDIRALSEQNEAYVIDRRRYYHAHPEVSGEERETRAQIRRDLEELGITEITEMKDCCGLTALIRGGRSGRTVALRADTDGLKIVEETGLPFAATNGSMHACGHDTHIAMLLGAAKVLQSVRQELRGTVKLVFQPAEELCTGARDMVKEGAMDGVDAIFGLHIMGYMDAPLIDVDPGKRLAGCDLFTIEVEGVAAHGSAPNLGVDAITVAAAIVNNLQQVVSRLNDPLDPLVVTIGTIHGGSRFNVIPNHVTMEGAVRTFATGDRTETLIRRITESTAAAFGAKATVDYRYVALPLINGDERLNRIARGAMVKLYGEEGMGHMPVMMGSEDFPWYGERVPYAFGFVGSRNVEKGLVYTNHHEKYTVDESVLKRGTALLAQFAADYLTETAE